MSLEDWKEKARKNELDLKAAICYANQVNEAVTAADDRFRNSVYVRHHDGSAMMLNHSFLMEYIGERTDHKFIIVISEHLKPQVFFESDLDSFQEVKGGRE